MQVFNRIFVYKFLVKFVDELNVYLLGYDFFLVCIVEDFVWLRELVSEMIYILENNCCEVIDFCVYVKIIWLYFYVL